MMLARRGHDWHAHVLDLSRRQQPSGSRGSIRGRTQNNHRRACSQHSRDAETPSERRSLSRVTPRRDYPPRPFPHLIAVAHRPRRAGDAQALSAIHARAREGVAGLREGRRCQDRQHQCSSQHAVSGPTLRHDCRVAGTSLDGTALCGAARTPMRCHRLQDATLLCTRDCISLLKV